MIERDAYDVWGIRVSADVLTLEERKYLDDLPPVAPAQEWVCAELDRVWHEFGLDNRRPLAGQPIDDYYRHPVWLMVGLYSAADPTSAAHRTAIASWVAALVPDRVVDVGGGFGELALRIGEAVPAARIEILEPFPSRAAEARLWEVKRNIGFVPELDHGRYDVVIAQDVLEHVEEPVELAIELARAARPGGTVIFANNFTPIMECHLPATFHLRRTFPLVMRALGLAPHGHVAGAEHALVFEVPASLHPERARRAAVLSRLAAPAIETAAALRRRARSLAARRRSG